MTYPAYPPSGPAQVSIFNDPFDPGFMAPFSFAGVLPPLIAALSGYFFSPGATMLFGNPVVSGGGTNRFRPMVAVLGVESSAQHGSPSLGSSFPNAMPLLWGPGQRGFLVIDPGQSSLT